MFLTLIYFILALLLLIIVHEFGHFIVARWCGVKVLRFSFGFGKVLYRWHDKRGTEYAWSAWPLGGYVKLLDETETKVLAHERHLAFNRQSVWVRIAIVLAGPLFNLMFAWFALWLALLVGIKSFAPIIAGVKTDSLAFHAGLTPQHEIIRLNEKKVNSWHDFQFAIMPLLGRHAPSTMTVKSLADNRITQVPFSLAKLTFDDRNTDLLTRLGIIPYTPTPPLVVGHIAPGSPAQKAGLELGDKLQSINQQPITNWFFLLNFIRLHPNDEVNLMVKRQGKQFDFRVKLDETVKNNRTTGYLGIGSKPIAWPKQWLRIHKEKPLAAMNTALQQTLNLTITTVSMIGRLVTGQLPLQTLSGPIGIAQSAGESGRSGLSYYLSFLALVSVSLGVLNLLPIPLLDGGHLFYYGIEIIMRRPLSTTFKTTGMYVGMVILFALMFVAFSNDFARIIRP